MQESARRYTVGDRVGLEGRPDLAGEVVQVRVARDGGQIVVVRWDGTGLQEQAYDAKHLVPLLRGGR